MSRWRMLLLALLAVVSLGAMPVISSSVAGRLLTSNGTVLTVGAVTDGQALVRSGSTITGSAVQASDADLTTWAGLTPSAYFQTLVDDASAGAALTTLGAPAVRVTTSAPTASDDSGDGYRVGDLWNDTAGNLTYIADSVGVGTADWRALLAPNGVRWYIADGVLYFRAIYVSPAGVSTDVSAAVAASLTGDPSSVGCSMAGANLTSPAGLTVGSSAAVQTTAQYWAIPLSAVGITMPSGIYRATLTIEATSFTEGARGGATHVILAALGVGDPQTISRGAGFLRSTSGTLGEPSFAWVIKNGSVTNSTASGAAGAMLQVRAYLLVGSTTSLANDADGFLASDAWKTSNASAAAAGLSGAITTLGVYCTRANVGTSTTDFTADGLTGSLLWTTP